MSHPCHNCRKYREGCEYYCKDLTNFHRTMEVKNGIKAQSEEKELQG